MVKEKLVMCLLAVCRVMSGCVSEKLWSCTHLFEGQDGHVLPYVQVYFAFIRRRYDRLRLWNLSQRLRCLTLRRFRFDQMYHDIEIGCLDVTLWISISISNIDNLKWRKIQNSYVCVIEYVCAVCVHELFVGYNCKRGLLLCAVSLFMKTLS